MVNYVCIIRCDRATILGTEYKCDKCWLMIAKELLPTGYVPKFGKLFDIILHGPEPNIILLSSTVCYNPRVGAYMVEPLPDLTPSHNFLCVYRQSLFCHHPFNIVRSHNCTSLYIKSKYDLSVYCNY